MIWHSSEIDDVLKELSVDSQKGLSNGVADDRLDFYGKNTITNIEPPRFLKIFLNQLKSGMVITLLIIAALSFLVSIIYDERDFYSPLLIVGIVALNSLINAYHIHSGEKILNSLKGITNPEATIIRDGIERNIPSDELVPGDILVLREGDFISADARIIEASEFRTNEALFTGEAIPVEKRADILLEEITEQNDRTNMIYSGTSVVHGTAKAVVVATGLYTEIGKTSAIKQQTGEEKLPLQHILKDSGKIINTAILLLCVLVFFINLFINFDAAHFASMTVKSLINATALAVAAIPEGLPAIATVVIGLGIGRIIQNNVIIKNTGALEILGKTSVLCADKTGLLTRHTMTVAKIFDGKQLYSLTDGETNENANVIIKLAATCSTLDNDATENAIEKASIEYNSMSKIDIENAYPRLSFIPFDADRKIMTTVNMINERPFAISKGAPENLVGKCVNCDIDEILSLNEQLTADALRVLCIAIKPLDEIPAHLNPDEIENGMTFVGLVALADPPISDAYDAIEICDKAGIRTIMITGDNPNTAAAVARRIGILKDGTKVLSGDELAAISDEDLPNVINEYSVFARVSPDDKLRIVSAFKKNGETVTITGDSIADSDALSAADTGCALGKAGTDIAKGSADIIVTNDRFISIVNAIKESRGLFENIRKSVIYLLSCNFSEVILYILGLIIFKFPPLAAVQLLWINLLTDSAPAFALSMENAESSVMRHSPLSLKGHIFNKKALVFIGAEALFMSAVSLVGFAIGGTTKVAMTITFLTVGLMQIFHSYNVKSDSSIFKTDFKSNRFMNLSTLLTAFILIFLSLTPAGAVFGLEALSFAEFMISLLLALAIVPFCEVLKLLAKKKII